MQYTIEALLDGSPVSDWYGAAKGHWAKLLTGVDATDSTAVAAVVSRAQMWFEQNCGGRWIGQEVMVVSGICQYYTTANGFGESGFTKALAMFQAFQKSSCSIEVKGLANEVAKLYPELLEPND